MGVLVLKKFDAGLSIVNIENILTLITRMCWKIIDRDDNNGKLKCTYFDNIFMRYTWE